MLKQLTSSQHPLVKHLVKLRQNRDYRYDHHSLVVEGVKIINELIPNYRFKSIVVDNEALIPASVKSDEIVLVTKEMMQKISGMQTSEGIVAEMKMPEPASLAGFKRILVLDGISDPGNMGALLRSALALGWEGAYIIDSSCDPFNEKTMRAARGATFRLPLAWGNWDHLKKIINAGKLEVIVADIEGKHLNQVKINDGGIALVLGNEARGPLVESKQTCTRVTIPMPGEMESLNVSVAGSIMMYVLGPGGKL